MGSAPKHSNAGEWFRVEPVEPPMKRTEPPASHETEALEIFERAIRDVGEVRARRALLAVKLRDLHEPLLAQDVVE